MSEASFVHSLRAGVWPSLDPSAETFISVQCASPGRGGELVGVCGVCAHCVGWTKEQYAWAACQVFLSAPPLGVAYCWRSPDWHLFSASPDRHFFSVWPPDWHFFST